MTAKQTSQLVKVLFFPDSHFYREILHTNGTLSFFQRPNQCFEKAKEPFFPSLDNNNNQINFKLINYGNN
jgi:hypothetical protein